MTFSHLERSFNFRTYLKRYFKPKYVAILFSLFSAGALFFSAYLNYKSYQKTLVTSLMLQSIGLNVALQSFLKDFSLSYLQKNPSLFSELLLNEKWEGVAFIAFYDKNKTILLHSNPELIGKKIDYSPLLEGKKNHQFIDLKTGERVFIYEDFFQLKDLKGIIRIALHIYPVENAINYAKAHLYLEIIIAGFFIIAGIFLFFLFNKIEAVKEKMDDLEKWQFISRILLHEIKNPLASIKGFTQYLTKKCTDDKFLRPLEIILRESLRIEKLMQSLFDFSHKTEIDAQLVNLTDLLTEVLSTMTFIYPKVHIEFFPPKENMPIFTDPDKLKSLIVNLLDNAITATLENQKNKVHIDLNINEGYYILKISDEGKGIDKELLPKIFEPFFTTKAKGTGLGLAIVKKISEELKIEVIFESEKNKGTTVWVKIPLSLS
ncbi:MAG: sensor histidine kinase [Caldimicrobium sp.]